MAPRAERPFVRGPRGSGAEPGAPVGHGARPAGPSAGLRPAERLGRTLGCGAAARPPSSPRCPRAAETWPPVAAARGQPAGLCPERGREASPAGRAVLRPGRAVLRPGQPRCPPPGTVKATRRPLFPYLPGERSSPQGRRAGSAPLPPGEEPGSDRGESSRCVEP
ncbi:uncharacterized protein [Lepidochelys kempii]|uniref:uncharacterized protein n=1 Tax=Lepidochelys kempii TaxID=8472 RepID=UPI003C70403E